MVWPFSSSNKDTSDTSATKLSSSNDDKTVSSDQKAVVDNTSTASQANPNPSPAVSLTRTMSNRDTKEDPIKVEAKRWITTEIDRKRIVDKLQKLHNELEKQNKELDTLVDKYAADNQTQKLRIGNFASLLLIKAEARARELGHRAVGTEDILWAMFHQDEKKESSAITFLKKRGVTKESLFAKHRYSDNAGTILKLAAQRSSDLNKMVVGTEDLLWAMFQTDDHKHSRSQAIQHLAARGINMDLVWNQAELSQNSQNAIKLAVERAKHSGHRIIGSEDLVEALFEVISGDEAARHRNVRFYGERISNYSGNNEDEEESIPRMFVVGGLAGVLETFIVQPLIYWKNMAQMSSQSAESMFSLKNLRPDVMYRGVLVNAASIGPISAVQYGANGALSSLSKQFLGKESAESSLATLFTAASTGALSAAVVTPAELVMISQQRSGGSVANVLSEIWKTQGMSGYFRGISATAVREAGWTFGFLGLAPVIKRFLQDDSKFFNSHDNAASMTSSVIAGQAAALLSQPADTIKTLLQADRGISSAKQFATSADAVRHLYSQPVGGGLAAFWRGIVPRSTRCIMAVYILSESQKYLSNVCDTYGVLQLKDD